jgi:signal transduction histidine kinase
MSNLVELLLRAKPEWERAYAEYLIEIEDQARLSLNEVSRLIEIFLESHLTGDLKGMMHLLDEWMQSSEEESIDPISFEDYLESSLIGGFHTVRAIMLHTVQQQHTDSDQVGMQGAIEQFFNGAVEYIAYKETTENLLRAHRRQKEIQEALEQLDQSRANFVSIAAHGLKTPLTLVEGYSQMLSEQLGSNIEEAKPLLAGIGSGTERMRELIDDLVDVAMIDNKMLSLYYQPSRLIDLIKKVIENFDSQVESKDLDIILEEFEGFRKTIFIDAERMEQALVEVVDNAIKFTPSKGNIQIQGRTLPGFIEISVTDTGVGIAAEDQVRIFEQFGKVSDRAEFKSESPQALGSGLGLHLCKGILEAHGGAIWVDSPGYDEESCPGSIFHLMIPVHEEPPDDPSVRFLGRSRA